MLEDFDIYADLEHNDREVEKESQELVALKTRIKELEKRLEATEQEKTDIIRRNAILLENMSSLMLTAKAEIKRKDTMISDLRRNCDNIAFGRTAHVGKSVNYATRFTQTLERHTLNVGVQTRPVDCNDPIQNRSREREMLCKSQIVQEREQYHGSDRSVNRENERYRDQEQNRDRDRYRDSYRERDRERYSQRDGHRRSERYRKRSQDSAREKVPKHNEGRTRNEERIYDEMHPSVHKRVNEADQFNRNTIISDHKRTCLETRSERTQDSKNYGKVTNTDSNHVSKRSSQKKMDSKMREYVSGTTERRTSKRATNECHSAGKDSVLSTELIDANSDGLGIQKTSKFRKQNVVGACTSIPQHDKRAYAVSHSKSINTDSRKDNHELCRSSKQSTKYEQNVDSSKVVKKIIEFTKDCNAGDQNCITKAQDNFKEINVGSHQSRTTCSTESPTFQIDPMPIASSKNYESLPEDERLNTNSEKVDVPTVSVRDTSCSEKEKDKTISNKEHNTFLSGNEIVSGTIAKPPAILNEASCSSDELSSEDPHSIPVDVIRNEDETTDGRKDIHSNLEVKHVQINITNVSGKKQDKRKSSSKRKLNPKPATIVLQNDGSEESTQNELCQSTRTNDELIPTVESRDNEVQNAEPCKLNTFRTRSSITNAGDASQTEKTQTLTHLETTINAEAAHNEIADEPDHALMLGDMEPNSKVPLVYNVAEKLISDETISTSNLLATAAFVPDTANEKVQNPSPISSADNNSHCFALRERRSNSCYSDVLEIGEPPPATMSIQTYFMNFNVQEVENEVISANEQSFSAYCVEPDSTGESELLNVVADLADVEAANSRQTNVMNEVQKKPKTSTAEIVRERLRKKNSATVQKAAPHSSATSMPVIPSKRRLSMDSASIACKRYKLDTVPSVDENKLSVSPSGKLSSTYFSQIALPITSALDSIPYKLRSPNIKQKAHDMLMTPMVVVHSPAKPSQEMGEHVHNNYYSLPTDDQSSLQNIMDSLLQTPIKNESSDNVSPPCANGLTVDEGEGQTFTAKNYENSEICLTPLSTKQPSRFSHDNGQGIQLFRKPTSIVEEKRTLKTFGESKGSFVPSGLATGREGEASNITEMKKTLQKSPSQKTKHLLGKHDDGTIKSTAKHSGHRKRCQSPKQMLNTISAAQNSSCLNVNNNHKTSSSKEKIKQTNVINAKSAGNCTAIVQQSAITTNSTDISIKVPQLKTPLSDSQPTHLKPQTTANSDNNNDTTKGVGRLVEKIPGKKVHQQATANVDVYEKPLKTTVTQSSSKRVKEDDSHFTTPSIKNSSCTVTSKTSTEKVNTNRPETSLKRSRKQKKEEEKQTEVIDMQRKVENDEASVRSGNEKLANPENNQPAVGCNYSRVEKVHPQHLEAQSTVSVNGVHLNRLNPQTRTEPSVPVNVLSTTNTCDKRMEDTERSELVVSNVTLNLSLADNSTNVHSIRKLDTPVQHVREMRIVKESPSLMRVFITRK